METTLRILLLEDAEDDEALLRRAITKGGITPIIHRVDSREALERALDEADYDVVVSDYSMPNLTPHEALVSLKERGLDIPVILVTGTIGENRAAAIMRAGAHDFILKEDLSRLVPAIQRELREAEGRRRQRVAEQERDKLSRVVEQTADAVLITDRQGRIEYLNPAVTRQTGYDAAELIGQSPGIFRSGAHDDAFYKNLWSTLLDGRTFRAIFTNRRKNGEHYFEAKTLTPLKNEKGDITNFISTGLDISEIMRVKEDLQKSNSILRATLESTLDAIAVTDLNRNIIDFNQRYCETWGSYDLPAKPWAQRQPRIEEQLVDPQPYFDMAKSLYADPEATQTGIIGFRDGRSIEYYSRPQRQDQVVTGRVWSFRDVTEHVRHEQQLIHIAHHDPLTNLPNRRLLEKRLATAVMDAARDSTKVGVLFLDIDRFSLINETLGHHAGDHLIMAVTAQLQCELSQDALLARTGGSEFVILHSALTGPTEAYELASALQKRLAAPIVVAGKEIFLTASLGISLYPDESPTAPTLLQHASSAMTRARIEGGDSIAYYKPHMSSYAAERLGIENALHHAITAQEFVLHYQPQVCLKTGRIIGVEALIRWKNREGELIPPGRFIPIAESTGLIVPITEWVFHTACTEARSWQQQGIFDCPISVNVSARLFNHGDLVGLVERTLAQTGLASNLLEIEITEGVIMSDLAHTTRILHELRGRGVRVSVDDFGTGYCALGYLRDFPLDTLKIDRSFVVRLTSDKRDEAVTETIIKLAHTFSLRVVAEGAETINQVNILARMGCDAIQGYCFSRPIPADACRALLARPKSLLWRTDS